MWWLISMRKTWLIAQHEFFVTTGRLSYRVFAGLVPLLAVLGLVAIVLWQTFSEDDPAEIVIAGFVDKTIGEDDDPIFNSFFESDTTTFVSYADEEAGTQALLDGTVDKFYVIPADYLSRGVVVEVKLEQAGFGDISDAVGNPNATPLGRFLLNNLFVGFVGTERSNRVLVPFQLAVVEIDETGQVVEDPLEPGRLIFFMAFAVLLMVSVFTTSGYLLQGLSEEKENRIMEVLLSSVKPDQLMLGKLFGLGAAGMLQMMIWAMAGVIFFVSLEQVVDVSDDLSVAPSAWGLFVGMAYFILGYLFFAALMATLGAITTSQREASQITFIVILPGIAPMWFLEQIISNPEGGLARVLSFIPFTAPVSSLTRLGVDSMGVVDVLMSLAVLAGGVALAMWITVRLFRAYLLTYGQRPSLRQIGRTLRGA